MKKIVYFYLLFLCLIVGTEAIAQGFTFVPLGSNSVQIPYIADSLQDTHIRGIVRNTSSQTLFFRFARLTNNLPADWTTQMCYDLCYAPQVDTISLNDMDPYSIPPGHEDTLFYISFIGMNKGVGTATVRMFNTNDPSQFVDNTFTVQIGGVGISNISSQVESYSLSQNYPNPFNPVTNIKFSVPNSESVSLKVYDILGNEVASLLNNEVLNAGEYKVDFSGTALGSGIYYYTIRTENFVETKKMILLK